MALERLREYPTLPFDPSMDFEVMGTLSISPRVATYGIEEYMLNSGQTLVYTKKMREGDEATIVPNMKGGISIGKKCVHEIVIAGYKVTPKGLLKWFKSTKIRDVPSIERPIVVSELAEKLGIEKKRIL